MNYKLLFIVVILFISCNHKSSTTTGNTPNGGEQILDAKEAAEPQRESLGVLIATIEFTLKASKEELKIFESGVVPWINLEKPDEEISRLIDAEKVVLPYTKATLIVDYPLNKPASFELSSRGRGFTRKQLIQEISGRYHLIYKEEEQSASVKTIPMEKRGDLMNRNETNGKYGVWGHDLSDLALSAVEVYQNSDGKITLVLLVES